VRIIGRKIFMVFAVCIFHGCGSTSDSPTEAKVTSVTFVNKGSVSPNSSSTTVVLNAKSLEHLTSQAEQVTEKWVRRLKTADFIPMQNSASALFDAPDVTLRSGQTSCVGWQGMTIIIENVIFQERSPTWAPDFSGAFTHPIFKSIHPPR
jgi:hypothetical protein